MTVYLVGAGPGDPGLLTLRGAEVLSRAEVVVHDRLADASLLDLAPPAAVRIDVGKAPGGPVRQDDITDVLVARGLTGAAVVRLKGGDPFVFGRGGEEALALAAAGVPFEIVPGVTSAVAVPAYAGVPVTHRGMSASFTVVTGHTRLAVEADVNWEALAQVGGTVVVLMGVAHRDLISRRLMDGGMPPSTPAVAVQWGTRPEQHTVRTTLAGLADAPIAPPATMVIGAVAGLDLAWYANRPLLGRRVVVTRAPGQASQLSTRLRDLGARPVEVPAIALAPPSDGGAALAAAVGALGDDAYDWAVFTSANAVHAVFELVRDARSFGRASVAAIGPGTADALAARGVVADLVPARSIAESLLEAFPDPPAPGSRVLLPRAKIAREVLPDGLRGAGWDLDVVEAYQTVPATPDPALLDAAASADAICFTSASTVTNYLAAAGASRLPPVVASIGPVTTAAATAAGVAVTVEAAEHTIAGLVDALSGALAPSG
ncbi:uroporphyrinogen-III C-methyltransferase [Acidiferrimicrobium sp. IK]|uniref:uroporphyrinogen-III C-methyltransferase n=1 Tax=Acidiferrimicrobium sp. IK TaxID=2871700 RepID=UPI0021CB32D0|nr:uroporphyrinogen-III C-methyltransferase [Acidiferrimicrobium sp. IK]MCU4183154.1 uroporphyrinogen-III C-methyltransferase [Acidiferrimicrobium sp. IK]